MISEGVQGGEHDRHDGTGRWPGEARPTRWRRGPAPDRRRRMLAKRKQSAVLRLLRGEDLELVSRELAVTAAELALGATPSWPPARVRSRPGCRWPRPRDRPSQGQGRRSDHGQRAARGQDRAPGGRPPFGTAEVEAMSRKVSPSANRSYGVQRVARFWGTSPPRCIVMARRRHRQRPSTGTVRVHAGRGAGRSDPPAVYS